MELETIVDTTGDDVGIRASCAVNLREKIHAAGVQAAREVFTENVLPEAKANVPVGSTATRDPHPGLTRDTMAVTFRDDPEAGWISAWIMTHSGFGWLIEHGTSHNRALTRTAKVQRKTQVTADRTPARPFIYPAMIRWCSSIADRAREILESL